MAAPTFEHLAELVAAMDVEGPVKLYRNLHRSTVTWSVQDRTGRVVGYCHQATLGDVRLVVRPAGAAKAQREGRRNVHAFVVGTPTDTVEERDWLAARYEVSRARFEALDGTELPPVTAARLDIRGLHVAA